MTKVTIKLTRPDDPAVRDLINRLLAGPTVLMAVTLFGGDRWSCVRDVALALDRTQPVGIATLAPTDELGNNGPHIIGVWVDPAYRRQGIGATLLRALRDRSLNRYNKVATVVAITQPGLALARHVEGGTGMLTVVPAVIGGVDMGW